MQISSASLSVGTVDRRIAQSLVQAGSEFELLVASCRFAFRGGGGGLSDIPSKIEWDRLAGLATRHRVEALVWNFVKAMDLAPTADATASEFSARAARTVAGNLTSTRQCAVLRDELERSGIPVIFVKGLTLGKLAYSDPFLKMSADIDILVAKDAAEAAASVLAALGYRLTIPSVTVPSTQFTRWHRRRKESVWRASSGLSIELHTRLADNRRLIPHIGLDSPQQLVEVANGIVLPTLATEELFAYLCVHGASSAWFRLKWISDLAGLLHGLSPAEITGLHERAVELGSGRAAAQALLLAKALFDVPLEPRLAERLEGERANRWLAEQALRALLSGPEPTSTLFGTWPIHITQFAMLRNPSFKLSELRRQLLDSVLG